MSTGYLIDITAEVFVGCEDDFLVFGERADEFFGVATSTDEVAQGFDFSRAVDVGDYHVVGVVGFEFGEFIGFATFC